jgi:hypothetical protein
MLTGSKEEEEENLRFYLYHGKEMLIRMLIFTSITKD